MSDEEDSMELDRFVTEKCLRCNRDGDSMKLLVCSVIGCPIAVHEECTGSEPEIDEKGRFYCPYCAHKRAVVRMEKLRRKALRAKEVLSMFIMSREISVPVVNGEGRDEVAVRNVGEIEGMGTERDASKGNAEQQCVLERHESDKRNVDNAMEEVPAVDAVVPDSGDFQGGSPRLRKKRYKKRAQKVQVQRVIPLRIVSSPSKKSSSCQTDAVEEDAEKQNEKDTSSSSSGKFSELDCNEKGAASSKSSDILELSQNEKAATSSEFRKCPESNQKEKVTTSCFDLIEVSESDRNMKATNNLSSESRDISVPSQNEKATEFLPKTRKVPDSNENEKTTASTEPIKVPESGSEDVLFHYGGRRRVNWTADELKTLKEGVLYFSTQVKKNLPWRKILDRGSHVFHKTRTPSNLKDKWQVLCREAS